MTTATERRLEDRRQVDRCRPDGGAFVITLSIFSIIFLTIGFVIGTWFGRLIQ